MRGERREGRSERAQVREERRGMGGERREVRDERRYRYANDPLTFP